MHNQETRMRAYRVKLGHSEVTVHANSAAEAIAAARCKLVAEMPLFYDVISRVAATRFEVKDAA